MKASAKYLFDDDFATGGKPTITLAEADRLREEAEAQAYRKGFAEGHAQAQTEQNQHIATALAIIGDKLQQLGKALNGIEARLETEAVEVAVAVAGKLASELIAREPFAEISALATECFQHLVHTPHIVVHIGSDIFEPSKAQLEEIASKRGFQGRLLVMPDPNIKLGDCRIEWAEGGVIRDEAITFAAINDAVNRYIAARLSAIQ
jgi:flagellar assembly protein FliH